MEKFNPAELKPIISEKSEPVKNLMESFDQIYYLNSTVTRRSKFGRDSVNTEGKDRPLFTRAHRAELYKKFKSLPEDSIDEKEEIILEGKIRDEINEQYFKQRDISIDSPSYGEQQSRIVDIKPIEGKNLPPIFFIPGISNDVECVGSFITEVAFNGRRIVTAGYPESFMGHTTQEFADAVEKDPGFTPHIEFYKAIIDKIFNENEEIEIWGFSTGAPIASGILTDSKYQQRTKDAVLIFPAASVDQKPVDLKLGVVKDLGFIKDNSSASLNLTTASKIPKEKEQLKLRDEIMGSLMKKIGEANHDWKEARVEDGGNIIVISGENDEITKSASMNEEFEKGNIQIKSTIIPKAYHSTVQVDPELVVSKIIELKSKFSK